MTKQDKVKKTPKYLYVVIPLAIFFVVYLWQQRTIDIKRACSRQAETTAHELYVSQLEGNSLLKGELQTAKEQGTYLQPVYEFEYGKCLELKGF